MIIENTHNGKKLFFAPGLHKLDTHVETAMREADCVVVDGTYWSMNEMIDLGFSTRTSTELGHLPQDGPNGMITLLDGMIKPRKILIHINNTNPILDEESAERFILTRHGIEVAFDGMEIEL